MNHMANSRKNISNHLFFSVALFWKNEMNEWERPRYPACAPRHLTRTHIVRLRLLSQLHQNFPLKRQVYLSVYPLPVPPEHCLLKFTSNLLKLHQINSFTFTREHKELKWLHVYGVDQCQRNGKCTGEKEERGLEIITKIHTHCANRMRRGEHFLFCDFYNLNWSL